MSKPEVLEKQPMTIVEVKAALESIKKTEEELNFRAAKTEEYGQDFARFKVKQAEELLKKLQALEVPRVKDNHLVKLIDVSPKTEKQLKNILSVSHLTVSNENVKKLLSTLQEYQ